MAASALMWRRASMGGDGDSRFLFEGFAT